MCPWETDDNNTPAAYFNFLSVSFQTNFDHFSLFLPPLTWCWLYTVNHSIAFWSFKIYSQISYANSVDNNFFAQSWKYYSGIRISNSPCSWDVECPSSVYLKAWLVLDMVPTDFFHFFEPRSGAPPSLRWDG